MGHVRRVGAWSATAAVIGLGFTVVVQAASHPSESLGGGSTPALALELSAGLGAWAAGLSLVRRRSGALPGLLLAATGPALFLGVLPLPGEGTLLFTAALALGTLTPALAGTSAIAQLGHPAWPDVLVVVAAFTTSWLWIGLLRALAFDPRASGCFECPNNLLQLDAVPSMPDRILRNGLYAAAACCMLLALLAMVRWLRLPAPVRGVSAPAVLGASGAAAAGALSFLHDAKVGFRLVDPTTRSVWWMTCSLVAVTAAGVVLRMLRARRQRQQIAGKVLDTLPSLDALRASLAQALSSPGLDLAFPRHDGTLVDGTGHPVDPPPPHVATTDVAHGDVLVAQIRHHPQLLVAPDRLFEVARGAGLVLQHAAFQARVRAELVELTASRVRIVEIGDAERQRLERNLHDGAQQRLIALSVSLQAGTPDDPLLCRSLREIQTAMEGLRALARGIHPVSLSDAGVGAAVQELSEDSSVPMLIRSLPENRSPIAAEAAVYRMVLDAVRCAERRGNGRAVVVSVESGPNFLNARLLLPGVDAAEATSALQHATDRYLAIEGTVAVRPSGHSTLVEGHLSCA